MNQAGINTRFIYKRKLLPKKIKILFSFIQIFFCLDFGFIKYKSPKVKFWSKFCALVLSACMGMLTIGMSLSLDKYYLAWGIKFLIEYYFYILILIYTPERRSFCFYLMELQYFDEQIGVDSSIYKMDTKIILYWSSSSLFDVLILCFYFNSSIDYEAEILLNILYFVPRRTFNLPLIVLFFVFYSMFCRLRQLKIYIKKRESSVLRALQLYRFLIDSIEKVMECFRRIFLVSLIFNIPGIMASIYLLLKTIQEANEINFELFVPYFSLIHMITVKAIPSLAASWLSQEAMKIRLLLHNRLIEESGHNESQALQRFIGYIEARPFRFFVVSMIPMDTAFLVMVLDFCITYLLVVIQFTHIY